MQRSQKPLRRFSKKSKNDSPVVSSEALSVLPFTLVWVCLQLLAREVESGRSMFRMQDVTDSSSISSTTCTPGDMRSPLSATFEESPTSLALAADLSDLYPLNEIHYGDGGLQKQKKQLPPVPVMPPPGQSVAQVPLMMNSRPSSAASSFAASNIAESGFARFMNAFEKPQPCPLSQLGAKNVVESGFTKFMNAFEKPQQTLGASASASSALVDPLLMPGSSTSSLSRGKSSLALVDPPVTSSLSRRKSSVDLESDEPESCEFGTLADTITMPNLVGALPSCPLNRVSSTFAGVPSNQSWSDDLAYADTQVDSPSPVQMPAGNDCQFPADLGELPADLGEQSVKNQQNQEAHISLHRFDWSSQVFCFTGCFLGLLI